ncbi:Uncharacterized protein SCF082_LOCUS46180 [Durusdinium trenchii]|uniref:Amine oxidase domain-containing protein n=1 Tax=Durusdinium trenchii TaxID=1381693 RepID=A0ABP0RDB7_9DINO
MVSMSPVNYAGLALYFVVLAISMIASYCSTKSGARRGASGLLIAVTWFYILRFTINYPKTSWYQDGLNLFDVAYADVIWGQETGNWGYTQMLLCWAIVGTVWTINAPLYYQLFGLFGAMSGSYCLILPEHRREREEDRDTVHISLLVACLMAFLCVWMLPMSKTYRELSWWLWGLHVCLIVPKVLGLGRLGPRVHKGIVYLVLAFLSCLTHLASSRSPWPSSDCQISISVDVLASSLLTISFMTEQLSSPISLLLWTLVLYIASPGFALGAFLAFYHHDLHSLIVTALQSQVARVFGQESTAWMNLGYWKSAKSYGEACQSLAEVIGQEAQLCEADEVLCVGCGQGQELQFFRERFHPTRLQGLDAHGTRPEAPEEIRVGRVEEMAHGVNHIRCGEFSKILAVDCVYHFQKARFLRDSAKLARESLSMTDVVLRPDAPWWIRLLLCAMNIQWSNHWTEPQYRKALEEAGFSKISWKSLEPHVLSQLPGLSSLAPYLDYVLIHAEVKKHPRPLAAVIGSGMSGLIAAHLLEATHDVVIFEAGPKCGLVGLQEDLGGDRDDGVAVDVPLRFMMPHYYQELLQVIRQLKIPTKAVPYNAAYQCGDEMLMFTVFFRPELPNETFLEYMKRHKLHDHEAYRIYSLHLSWMLSCTYEQANGTPAGVILGFIRASNPFVRMYQSSGNILRVYPTMRALQDRLLEGKVLKVNSPVAPFNGSREIDGTMYDAVIVATDAPAAGYLLGGEWQAMLSKIHYQKGRIIVHKDPALMPPKKEDWRTFNVREDGPDSTCQITVWLNKFWGRDDLSENLFETWNPAQECSPDLKVKDVQLSRATYTTAMHELWSWIQEKQGQDGFYVAGAYTLEGMSLSLSC